MTDVLVAGAGPAGAATAIRLARAGLRVTVVDRATFPRHKACSEYLSPEGVRHLAALGVLESVERSGGQPIRGTTVTAPRGARLTGLFAAAGHPWRATGLSVSRHLLDHALVQAARAAGATVLEATTARAVLRSAGGVTGLLVEGPEGSERALRARLTIGADGLHSLLARSCGRRVAGPLRRYGFVAHLRGVAGLADTAELHVGSAGYAGLNPLGAGLANVAVVVPAARAAAARGRAPAFFFEELSRHAGIRGRLKPEDLARPLLVTGPFATRAREVTGDGWALVGDAADFFDPFTGEGVCAALRGAELLEPVVRNALAVPGLATATALAPYRAARRRAFGGKWVVERAIACAMLAPRFFDRAVERLERRGLAHLLIGVTGDFVPPRAVLNPRFLSQLVF